MESANCGVRLAESGEAVAVADLLLRSRRAAHGIPASVHDDEEVRVWVRDRLLPSCDVWIATEGEQLVGMIAVQGEWIEQLYVSPIHQRRGHGTRLLQLAKATGDSLALWTFEANLIARHFYETHGFTQEGAPNSNNEEGAPAIGYRWRRAISDVVSQPN
jgi:GNAT superfamily N-acetyltransferase